MGADEDRAAIKDAMNQARQDFKRLLAGATTAELRRPSAGTKWTNQQLLFHMLFGYLVTRTLLILASGLGRLPGWVSRAFAGLLNAAKRPFDVVNYLGSCLGARLIPPARMGATMDRVIDALQRSLDRRTAAALSRGIYYPTRWDPFFTGYMTLTELYRYPTLHFRFHERQLTLTGG